MEQNRVAVDELSNIIHKAVDMKHFLKEAL
jgi:hypothetical protein